MRFCGLAGLVLTSGLAVAQPVLLTAPTTINQSDTTVGGIPLSTAQITVEGTTLTVNGSVTIASLALRRNGTNIPAVLTHAAGGTAAGSDQLGMVLTVTGDVTIQGRDAALPASAIDVSGKGYASDQGPGRGFGGVNQWGGGAGHGGTGAFGQNVNSAFPGVAYGDLLQPALLGSGGGANVVPTQLGGTGGGAIRLIVGGTLTCDGMISAGGAAGQTFAGGGSGGSIWITAGTLAGASTGEITANGGQGTTSGGGGGGGRIAVYAATNTYAGSFRASGASGTATYAAPGTVVVGKAPDQRPDVSISQPGVVSNSSTPLPLSLTVGRLTLGPRATVIMPAGSSVSLDATSLVMDSNSMWSADSMNLTVGSIQLLDPTATLTVRGRGFGPNSGPGAGGGGANDWGGGGGHAGKGGRGAGAGPTPIGGMPYGDFAQPITAGSGGGNNDAPRLGGPGGGVMRIVANTIELAGTIDARGATGNTFAGGGAGGSIWITANSVSGTGGILASGAGSGSGGGGGSGGRIALYGSVSPTVLIEAVGGTSSGGQHGAAGSVYRLPAGTGLGTVTFDNGGQSGAPNLFANGSVVNANLVIANKAQFQFTNVAELNQLAVIGSLTVGAGTSISVDALGFGSDSGPGTGFGGTNNWGGGGAYGGAGGNGQGGPIKARGGTPYGSVTQPLDPGSGGGANDAPRPGGTGGGAVRLDVGGTFTLNGAISANGTTGATFAGGGSGGSIYLVTPALLGSGTITARGGDATSSGGGGGGGRIAIYACGVDLPITNITAPGGTGFQNGENGSIFFGGSSITISAQPVSQSFNYNDAIVQLSVTAQTSRPGGLTYQWRQRNGLGEYIPLTEGQAGRFVDVNESTLTIVNASCLDDASYDCLITDSCGSFPSKPARLTIGRRIGDFDESGGTPDVGDIQAFFDAWLLGSESADVDNSGGTPDVSDIDIFFRAWLEGC